MAAGGIGGMILADGWVLAEDLIDLAGWMVQAKKIPAYVDWDEDAAADAQAEAAMRANEALF